jgi:hypothetical protein
LGTDRSTCHLELSPFGVIHKGVLYMYLYVLSYARLSPALKEYQSWFQN